MFRSILFFFVFTTLTLTTSLVPAWSMEVIKVRDQKVLIKLNGESASLGQIYTLIDSQGRKKGVVKITQIKGDRAISQMSRQSKAKPGWSLQFQSDGREDSAANKSSYGGGDSLDYRGGSGGSAKNQRNSSNNSYAKQLGLPFSLGFFGGMNSAKFKVSNIGEDPPTNNGEAVTLDGTGYNFEAFMDYSFNDSFSLRGSVGMEQFKTDGNASKVCYTTPASKTKVACFADIQYLFAGGIAQFTFTRDHFIRPWVGAGMRFMIPMDEVSTAINVKTIKNSSTFGVASGLDIGLQRGLSIPVQFEYNTFLSSDNVKAQYFSMKIGFKLGL